MPNKNSKKKNKIKKWEQFKRSLDNIKHTNTCTIGVLEGEEREKGVENVFNEIMAERVLILKKKTYLGTGDTEGPKQNEPKQNHTKPYHN